jgi:pimeloyl-ACP methyl ester carboxylesterase
LLITGSGPQDRDETLPFQHRPFLVLADYLTRHGIVVLRADDRGVGKSTGNFAAATTADFATDTEAGLAYLKKRPEVNVHKLGLIGHSEGGVIAPMVAARDSDVSFIVLLAGPGVRGDEIIPAQLAAILEAGGADKQEAEKSAAAQRDLLVLSEHEKDDAVIQKKISELSNGRASDAQAEAQAKQIHSAWYQYFLQYDPAPALEKVKCPVLALNGEKDRQVPASQNLPAIRKALEAGGNTHFEVDELPGLNHLFQTARTGAPAEYSEIEETMSPLALDKISGWILKQ